MPSASLPLARRSAIAHFKSRSLQRVPLPSRTSNARAPLPACAYPIDDLLVDDVDFTSHDEFDVRGRTSARSIMDYRSGTKVSGYGSNGTGASPHDAVVLSVLQNYSGLSQDRLFNMLRNSGRFNESQSTLSSILSSLVSQGKVQNESGTYRFVSGGGGRASVSASRSPSPPPSRFGHSNNSSSSSRSTAYSNGSGNGSGNAGDEAAVLSVLQNYAGLTEQRLTAMIRASGKSMKSNVNTVLSSLVSQGKVQNDRGTFRFLTRGSTPSASRSSSSASSLSSRASISPTRSYSPAPSRGNGVAPGPGSGASAGDEAIVLSVLQNYSGLTEDRLSSMIRNSRQSMKSDVRSVLSSLVSQGKVQNDKGTFRFLTRGSTPAAARAPSSSSARSPMRGYSPTPSRGNGVAPGPGSGASAGDEATVLSILQNYSGLTEDRLSSMVRNSRQTLGSSLNSVLSSLVSQGKVQNDRGTFRFLTRGSTPTPARTASPVPQRNTPARGSSTPRRATPAAGGAAAGDDAVVLSVLKNYSGLTEERLSSMLRNSGKSLRGSLRHVLDDLVRSRKVQFTGGMYRM